MRDSSSIFHAYAMHVHLKLRPHAGVETTMREIYLKIFVLGNPRRIVSKIRKDCSRCRRIHLKTVDYLSYIADMTEDEGRRLMKRVGGGSGL